MPFFFRPNRPKVPAIHKLGGDMAYLHGCRQAGNEWSIRLPLAHPISMLLEPQMRRESPSPISLMAGTHARLPA
jgi:hypothetical protein